ncbi:MAG TPA: tetratricopeptide repeat protein [Anaeromyxobacteraceae bacterium]|nr:tetratricopeptide repeat protein [Anaeromyxobacteraceae bacterium]
MPAPRQLSPAEIAALEHAFASDPTSEAYRPLAEAYLALGRFMEAMVVCKKGVKAHPANPAARVLLARVYAEQGKDRKALEEAQGALQEHPGDVGANRMAGVLHLKLGEREAGEEALRRAAGLAPGDPETLEALKKWGVAVAAPAPATRVGRLSEGIPVAPRVGQRGAAASPRAPAASAARAAPAPPPAAAREPAAGRNVAYAQELADKYGTQEFHLSTGKTGEIPLRRGEKKGPGLKASMLLVVALAGGLVGWYAYSTWKKQRAVKIDGLLKQTRELVDKDSYASYREAARLADEILRLDADSIAGHAFLAYVDALRWGEHGEGDAVREEARGHLESAHRLAQSHSHAIAAGTYLKFFGGDPKGAVEDLERVLKGPEAGTSGLLYGQLGFIQMQTGDLDGARDSLTTARKFADRDVRVNQMLAEQFRRRGLGYELQAITFYEAALRLGKDHVPSLLGVSQMLIGRDQLDEALRNVQKVLDAGDASPRQLALARALKGAALYGKGKSAEGAGEEQQALVLDPANPDIHAQVGRRRLAGGDVPGAVDSFRRAVQMDPQRVSFYVELANAMLRREGGAKQAIEALRAATGRLAGNARIVKLLGDAYRADGDLDRARAEYEKALSMEKRFPDARVSLARVWRERRDWARALDELDKAAKEYGEGTTGGAARAYVEMAEIEAARGARAEVVDELYKKALRADGTNCTALWVLGRERADRRSKVFDKELGKQMLSDYARLCPKGAHAAEANRIAASLK